VAFWPHCLRQKSPGAPPEGVPGPDSRPAIGAAGGSACLVRCAAAFCGGRKGMSTQPFPGGADPGRGPQPDKTKARPELRGLATGIFPRPLAPGRRALGGPRASKPCPVGPKACRKCGACRLPFFLPPKSFAARPPSGAPPAPAVAWGSLPPRILPRGPPPPPPTPAFLVLSRPAAPHGSNRFFSSPCLSEGLGPGNRPRWRQTKSPSRRLAPPSVRPPPTPPPRRGGLASHLQSSPAHLWGGGLPLAPLRRAGGSRPQILKPCHDGGLAPVRRPRPFHRRPARDTGPHIAFPHLLAPQSALPACPPAAILGPSLPQGPQLDGEADAYVGPRLANAKFFQRPSSGKLGAAFLSESPSSACPPRPRRLYIARAQKRLAPWRLGGLRRPLFSNYFASRPPFTRPTYCKQPPFLAANSAGGWFFFSSPSSAAHGAPFFFFFFFSLTRRNLCPLNIPSQPISPFVLKRKKQGPNLRPRLRLPGLSPLHRPGRSPSATSFLREIVPALRPPSCPGPAPVALIQHQRAVPRPFFFSPFASPGPPGTLGSAPPVPPGPRLVNSRAPPSTAALYGNPPRPLAPLNPPTSFVLFLAQTSSRSGPRVFSPLSGG